MKSLKEVFKKSFKEIRLPLKNTVAKAKFVCEKTETCLTYDFVAQSVKQWIKNPITVGSNPTGAIDTYSNY